MDLYKILLKASYYRILHKCLAVSMIDLLEKAQHRFMRMFIKE